MYGIYYYVSCINVSIKVQSSKATDVEIQHYCAKSDTSLNAIIPPDSTKCIDTSCNCNKHQMQLDAYFDSICNALYHTSKETLSISKIKCSSEYIVSGFNDYLKELHTNAINCDLTWTQMGKPRGDGTDIDMQITRLQFKYAPRQCRMDEDMIRADALTRSLYCKHTTSFWKGVKSMRDNDVLLVTKVGDAVGDAGPFLYSTQQCSKQ